MINKYYIFIIILCFSMNISAQEASSIDGIWRYGEGGYSERLGMLQVEVILTIKNGKYIWMEEMISESGIFWSSGKKGTIIINNYEIKFTQEEITFVEYESHLKPVELNWKPETKKEIYTYYIDKGYRDKKILYLLQNDLGQYVFFEK